MGLFLQLSFPFSQKYFSKITVYFSQIFLFAILFLFLVHYLLTMNQSLKHSVFIVDDDQDDRESIRDAFLENNHLQDYVFMKSGEQLLYHFNEKAANKHPSLILLDLNMPAKDGRDVLKEIKGSEELRFIPIIVITTSASDKDREISYQLGANCFLTKPNSYDELVKITDCIAKLWLH